MLSVEKKLSMESRLPTLILFEDHDNPDIQNFYEKILPILKNSGYKKLLVESLPSRQLDIAYFDEKLAMFESELAELEASLKMSGKFDIYNSKNKADKFQYLASLQVEGRASISAEEKRSITAKAMHQCSLPRYIAAFKRVKVILNFGFNVFGTENELVDIANTSDPLLMCERDALNANTLVGHHHNAIKEGGVLMELGLFHLPGIRENLIKRGEKSSDYIFIYLTNIADRYNDPDKHKSIVEYREKCTSVIAKSADYNTFKLFQIRLDSSEVGRPDVAVANVLSLDQRLPHISELWPSAGISRMTALKLERILGCNIQSNREIAFSLRTRLDDKVSKIQAIARGHLIRKEVVPLLYQFKQCQTEQEIEAVKEEASKVVERSAVKIR